MQSPSVSSVLRRSFATLQANSTGTLVDYIKGQQNFTWGNWLLEDEFSKLCGILHMRWGVANQRGENASKKLVAWRAYKWHNSGISGLWIFGSQCSEGIFPAEDRRWVYNGDVNAPVFCRSSNNLFILLSKAGFGSFGSLLWVIPGQVITKNGRTPSDFDETWYMHTLSEVINPHPFLASYVIWLLSYNFSKNNVSFWEIFSEPVILNWP